MFDIYNFMSTLNKNAKMPMSDFRVYMCCSKFMFMKSKKLKCTYYKNDMYNIIVITWDALLISSDMFCMTYNC